MNEFTKDELELILGDLDHAVFSRYYAEGKAELRGKILSVLDKYCEHECFNNVRHCVDCGVSEYKCNKCGEIKYEGLE